MAHPFFSTTIAGSLPKPGWLSKTNKLWLQQKVEGAGLAQAKADAALLWINPQEDTGLEAAGDGEQSHQPEAVSPSPAKSSIRQVSLKCCQPHVSPYLMAQHYMPKNRLLPYPNCGVVPMDRDVALKKLQALEQGATLARQRYDA